MATIYQVGKTWTVAWFDPPKVRNYARGIPSKRLANQIASDREFGKHAARHGVIEPEQIKYSDAAGRSLASHLDDYTRRMKGDGRSPKHIQSTRANVERIFRAAGITRIDRIDGDAILRAIEDMKPLRGEAELSHARRNRALAACKSFGFFLLATKRIPTNPLQRAKSRNEDTDRKRVRKVLTDEQAQTLFATTLTQPARAGMTGEDRAMRYALALGTGLRQGTLFKLTPESFHLNGIPAFVRVKAGETKNRQGFDQPITAELANDLRAWLASKPARKPVFPKMPHGREIIAWRHDLEAAGIVYHEEGTNEYCDLHALRNAYITGAIRSGGLKAAQDLARHSTPTLTSRYGRMEMIDYAKALAGLPVLKRTTDKNAAANKKKQG